MSLDERHRYEPPARLPLPPAPLPPAPPPPAPLHRSPSHIDEWVRAPSAAPAADAADDDGEAARRRG